MLTTVLKLCNLNSLTDSSYFENGQMMTLPKNVPTKVLLQRKRRVYESWLDQVVLVDIYRW